RDTDKLGCKQTCSARIASSRDVLTWLSLVNRWFISSVCEIPLERHAVPLSAEGAKVTVLILAAVSIAGAGGRGFGPARRRWVCQSERRERGEREAEAEFLERGAPRGGLGQALA